MRQKLRVATNVSSLRATIYCWTKRIGCDLSQFWGYSVFVEADFDELERRLINRWLDHGLDRAAAKKLGPDDNDIVNAATVLNHRMPSDLTLSN
jgi:pantothenate kinase